MARVQQLRPPDGDDDRASAGGNRKQQQTGWFRRGFRQNEIFAATTTANVICCFGRLKKLADGAEPVVVIFSVLILKALALAAQFQCLEQ